MQIVQRLRELQNRTPGGYLPDEALRVLAKSLGVPLARIEEITTFFPAYRPERDKPTALEVRVCRDMTCHLRGAAGLIAAGERLAEKVNAGGGSLRVEGVSCLGRCDRAPVAWAECEQLRIRNAALHHHELNQATQDGGWGNQVEEHAWVFTNLTEASFLKLLDDLRSIRPETPPAKLGKVAPKRDTDAGYPPNTNAAIVGNKPLWEIDVYGRNGWPPDYRGVAGFIQFLGGLRRRAVPRPPVGAAKAAVEKHVRENHPWLWRLKEAGLNGMGGALASAYQKWFDVWEQWDPQGEDEYTPLTDVKADLFTKYVIANGDESEPGTFKDREVMLRLPHLVVEGVILAGLVVGAAEGYIFVRHEYHEQIAALRAEVARAERLGACGPSVFGSGREFPVTVVESPGGYICGEQSALIEAMEDRRGQPRNKPPEITANGFRDRPTVLNNVETLAWVPHIMLASKELPPRPPETEPKNPPAYPDLGWKPPKAAGTDRPPPRFGGKRLFSVSGDVARPGVYEVPIGLPLGDLLGLCGGVVGELKAVATSGPSGGFLPARLPIPPKVLHRFADLRTELRKPPPPDAKLLTFEEWFVLACVLDADAHVELARLPLDKGAFDWLKSSGVAPLAPLLGAGIAVYAAGTDVLDQAVNFTRFFRNESCGKCVPCRIGTQKLVQLGTGLLERRAAGGQGTGLPAVERDLIDLTVALVQTSICSLGASAPSPLASALTYFPADVQAPPPPAPRGAP